MIRSLLAAVPLIVCAGCARDTTTYPSLAPRPAESRGFADPTPAAQALVADPVLDARLASLTERLTTIDAGFADAARLAERRAGAARGRAAGSDPWLDAQTALAGLDDWRAQLSALAADIEQLAIARAGTLAPPYVPLTALSDQADAEASRQTATIDRLQAMLAPA